METYKSYQIPTQLAAGSLANDKRILEAKKLIKEAVMAHQQRLTQIKPPSANLKQNYEDLLNEFQDIRGGKLWFPYIGSGIGHGPLVELLDGSVKYDFISGIGVHYLGHSHLDIIETSIDAAISDTIMQGNLQQNIDSLELSKLLVQESKLPHCFLTSSGAMANENALKIAFQKRFPATRVLAFEHCFTGRTLTISQITDKPSYREGLPMNLQVDYLPFFDPDHPEQSIKNTLKVLNCYLTRYPKAYALMCFEFIQGEGGFYSGSREFFQAIVHVLKHNQIAIFADEVQTFGRTQNLFAYQYFGLESYIDIASLGKLSQVCATLFTDEYKPKTGLLSQTFTASTSAIKASFLILKILIEGNYFGPEGKIQQLHEHFVKQLKALAKNYPHLIQGPFGTGCMIAFTPYDGHPQKVIDFVHRLFEAGVISFIAGNQPTRVRFLIPAGAITFKDIDEVCKIIEQTLL